MSPGDHLSTAVETVEELSVPLAEFAPDRLGLGRDEPRRPLPERAQDVRLGVGRVGVVVGGGVPAGAPVAVVFHTDGWGRTGKSFSAARRRDGSDSDADRRRTFIPEGEGLYGMDRLEHGVAVEPEPEAEEPLGAEFGLDSRRAVVEFLAVLVVVMTLAATTSVLLVPA